MTDRPTTDDATSGGEEDELFAAVTAAIARPPRRDSETFQHPPEPEPEPEPERDTRYDHLFGPQAYDDEDADDDGGDDGGDGEGLVDGGTTDEQPRRTHRIRTAVLGVAALVGAAYLAGHFVTGTRMPVNTTIAGVDVSGASPADARATLTRELTPQTERPIALTFKDKDFQIAPADAGLSLDAAASVEAAGGTSSWDPRDMVALVIGDHPHDAVVATDRSKFDGVLGTLGESVDTPVVEAQITFPKATPRARSPKAGEVLNRVVMTDRIKDAFVGVTEEPVPIERATVQPAVDQAGLDAAMTGVAAQAVSGPVTLEVGDTEVDLPVSAYAPALVIRVEDGALTPYIDPKKLAGPLTDSTTGVGKKAVDATVVIRGGKPKVVAGKEGVGLQPDEMAVKLLPAIVAEGEQRSVSVEASVVEPAFTTADAKALKITEKISEFETKFPYAEYRNINQGRAAKILNGTIVRPGKVFSFNDTVGERTEANGFTTGTVINGGVFREELGGGVSQVVTTTYNAAFFGGMDDTEHHPHAFYINRYPVGREATVYYGSLDLRFKNPTDYGVLIRSYVTPSAPGRDGVMHVELWSTQVWDKITAGASERRNFRKPGLQYDDSDRCVPQAPIQGFDIDIYRTFVKGGKKVRSETDKAVYQAADKVICGKKPKKPAEDG